MYFLKKILFRSPAQYLAALILSAVVAAYRYFTLPAGVGTRFALYEIFSVTGLFTVLVGALLTVAYFGAFDIFGYAFRFGGKRKYENYADYAQQTAEKRARGGYYFVPFYVLGTVILLISFFFA